MLVIRIICVGKMKEQHFIQAMREYEKRLAAFCKAEIIEIPEVRLSDNPGASEIEGALKKEAAAIGKSIDRGFYTVAMCIEGKTMDSQSFSAFLEEKSLEGVSRIAFIIGGSFGLHDSIKNNADYKLSMSPMTFPHHLARVMLTEQIYRGFQILQGGKYHK